VSGVGSEGDVDVDENSENNDVREIVVCRIG
jgi:hypothetical protein